MAMSSLDDAQDAHQQVYGDDDGGENKAKFSHELIAGGAAFEGFKLFEDRQRKEGERKLLSWIILSSADANSVLSRRQARLARIRQGSPGWIGGW